MKRKELFINLSTKEFFLRTWNLEYVSSTFIGGIPVGATNRLRGSAGCTGRTWSRTGVFWYINNCGFNGDLYSEG